MENKAHFSSCLEASQARPDGYYRVKWGKVRPDDLVWSIFERKFLRADAEWPFPPTNYTADDLTYVIRTGTANPEIWLDVETPEQEAPARRSYRIQRELF